MKRFALLVAAGVLWLFVAALPAFADGGPHVMTVNNGSLGLNGDCASCHRAHTASAADLLTASMPTLCTNCHNGTKATTDVIDGVQFAAGTMPYNTGFLRTDPATYTTVVGALRGGGFNYALMGTPSRLITGGQYTLTLTGTPTAGSFVLTLNGTPVTIQWNDNAAAMTTAFRTALGTSPTYPSAPTTDFVTVTGTGPFTIKLNNELRKSPSTLTVNAAGLTGATAAVVWSDPMYSGNFVARVGVATTASVTTSRHDGGNGIVWGNGAQGTGTAGVSGVVLDCAKCHNPHGNGQYRILNTTPGEDWSTTAPTFAVTNTAGVEVKDTAFTPGTVRNYTVNPSASGLVGGIVGTYTQGDYWRKTYDPTGASNFTNFYLAKDEMNTGWNGVSAVNKAANGGTAPANTTGLMTAWCIQCHTRYNGYNVNAATGVLSTAGNASAPSLIAQTPTDADFMFKHGTTRYGCEQCHVSHGSNAAMDALSSVNWPGQDPTNAANNDPDSRLLKVANRGTCQLCHDPTGTVVPGDATGPIPALVTGAP